jgi:hypothetical protein
MVCLIQLIFSGVKIVDVIKHNWLISIQSCQMSKHHLTIEPFRNSYKYRRRVGILYRNDLYYLFSCSLGSDYG